MDSEKSPTETLVVVLIACADVVGDKYAQKHGVRFGEMSATTYFRPTLAPVADACVLWNDLRPLNPAIGTAPSASHASVSH